jgi:hypothetical protein
MLATPFGQFVQREREQVGARLAHRKLCGPLAFPANDVTTSAERCIALLGNRKLALIGPSRVAAHRIVEARQ